MLAASKHLRSLRVLELGNNWLGSQGISALLREPRIAATLEDIHTRPGTGNNYGGAILDEFLASDMLTLRYLDCWEANPDALIALWSSPRAASLRRLTVPAGSMTDGCVERLVASPYLEKLGALEIRGVVGSDIRAMLADRLGARLVAP
jgi:hypothetical protein